MGSLPLVHACTEVLELCAGSRSSRMMGEGARRTGRGRSPVSTGRNNKSFHRQKMCDIRNIMDERMKARG